MGYLTKADLRISSNVSNDQFKTQVTAAFKIKTVLFKLLMHFFASDIHVSNRTLRISSNVSNDQF